ncbi:MAG: hypothetical protein HY071_01600 [Chloroflexi bacterium]|nr:hypothetical protein [Chloroflexota bacterium]
MSIAGRSTLSRGLLAEHPLWARALAQEGLSGRLILPVVVSEAVEDRERVEGTAGLERLSITEVVRQARAAAAAGLAGLLVYGASDRKDEHALIASQPDHVVPRAVRALKQALPDLAIATDLCVCAYTAHGQCVLFGQGGADVNGTLERLREIAVVHADAGADLIIPSGMLDGATRAVHDALQADHREVPVAAMEKLESTLYTSERLIVGAVPIRERAVPLLSAEDDGALRSRAQRDLASGADALVLAPGAPTLDLARMLRELSDRPLMSFHTADEHATFAGASELIDAPHAEREGIRAARRAGADLVISHGALGVAEVDQGS